MLFWFGVVGKARFYTYYLFHCRTLFFFKIQAFFSPKETYVCLSSVYRVMHQEVITAFRRSSILDLWNHLNIRRHWKYASAHTKDSVIKFYHFSFNIKTKLPLNFMIREKIFWYSDLYWIDPVKHVSKYFVSLIGVIDASSNIQFW